MLEQGYWIMPNKVLYSTELSDKQKLLFCVISSLCAEKGYCRATNEHLWELLWVDKLTISRHISQLQEKWYISIEIISRNERKIRIDENIKGDWQKRQGGIDENINPLYIYTNITNIITIEKIFSSYYWKTKWIDEKRCTKLINDKLKQWSTLDDIWKWMILYNCERRLKQDRDHVMKFETWIKWYQQLDEDQTDEQIKIVAKSYKEKMLANPKFTESKVAKTVWEDLCDAFGEQKIREIWKSEWKKEISLNLK